MRPRRKSIVWQYFTRTNGSKRCICHLCKREYTCFSNTTNLLEHLKRKHAIQSLKAQSSTNTFALPEPPINVYNNSEVQYKVEVAALSTTPSEEVTQSTKAPPILPPLRLLHVIDDNRKDDELSADEAHRLNESLIAMIAIDFQPLSFVENAGFLQLSQLLNPKYKLPSKNTLKTTLIPNKYHEIRNKITNMLGNVQSLAITTDTWISDEKHENISVTSHFIFARQSYATVLSTKVLNNCHNTVCKTLSSIFTEFDIKDKITTIVSNNDHVNEGLQIKHHPCVAHELNATLKEAIDGDPKFTELIKKCCMIEENTNVADCLPSTQTKMSWWNTIVMLLEKLWALKPSIEGAATNQKLKVTPSFLIPTEWDIIGDCIPILQPFCELTNELSEEKYPMMSKIVPLIRGLQYRINQHVPKTQTGRVFKRKIADDVKRHLCALESNKVVAKATFLDPRFKAMAFGSKENALNAQQCIIDELTELLNDKNSTTDVMDESEERDQDCKMADSLWFHFDNALAYQKSETKPRATAALMVAQYLDLPQVPRSENPMDFWKNHEHLLPEIFQLAMKYLCVPAIAVPSDRLFSQTGILTNAKRNRLSSKDVELLVFLNGNIKL